MLYQPAQWMILAGGRIAENVFRLNCWAVLGQFEWALIRLELLGFIGLPNSLKQDVELKIVDYLITVNYSDAHEIHRRVYPGGFPVIGKNETLNALKRLERRGIVHVEKMYQRGWYRQKLWAVTRKFR